MHWTETREGRDSAAAWAIPHLRGVPQEGRIEALERLIKRERMTGLSAEDLNKWCHAYMQPDIASGLVTKDTEAHAAALDRQAAVSPATTDDEEPTSANQYRAEGFRTFAELIGVEAGPVRWWYPKGSVQGVRIKGVRRRRRVGLRVAYRTIEGAGTVTMAGGQEVAFLSCCTVGERGGRVVWALPEVGAPRLWLKRTSEGDVLEYQVRQVERMDARSVIGARAIALAATYAPAVVGHRPEAEVARECGVPSKQLLHHHKRGVEARVEVMVKRASDTAA
ncbi:MAG: hypothetical protein JWM59_3603 [Verrucomicrobiales bacterium]|nr:hypothetical protein [Verrucomicrobiales bacterium]